MANSILVDDPLTSPKTPSSASATPRVTGWITTKVEDWEDNRNEKYLKRWNEYYRLWRGLWHVEDKTRQVERSRIIAPALQQAIEASCAEMEESVFHRKRWFDLDQDVMGEGETGEEPNNLQDIIDTLLEDFDRQNVPRSISEILLNGALYGTGIGKICVEKETIRTPVPGEYSVSTQVTEEEKVRVSLVAVDPREFVIDPAATCINKALGVAHVYRVPLHDVLSKQASGVYRDTFIGAFDETSSSTTRPELEVRPKNIHEVEIIEYHGLVPKKMFDEAIAETSEDVSNEFLRVGNLTESDIPKDNGADMVECIVWIGNRGTLLKIVRNPFIMQDRSFVAFQYDTVPNRFWGRGVAEKGYNPQKALDAELRARIDSLALSTYPMTIINGLMAPRNQDYSVRPGRNIVVSGNVGEAMAPFKFPPPDPQSYRQTAEFERMVTVATGAMDTAAPLGVNPRNETASGMSMMLSAVLKRSKRTLRNIENQFLSPLVHKFAWRYMQFDNERYPVKDYHFKVVGALGAQAREFEVAQLTQLLQTQPAEQPGYWIILRGIMRNYNVEDKEDLIKIIDGFLQQSLQPKEQEIPPEIQVKLKEQERKMRELQWKMDQAVEDEVRKDAEVEAEAARDRGEAIWNTSEAVLNARKAETEYVNAIAKLVTAMKTTGEGGEDIATTIARAEKILNGYVDEAQGEPELAALRSSMERQQKEEIQPGIGEEREVTPDGDNRGTAPTGN